MLCLFGTDQEGEAEVRSCGCMSPRVCTKDKNVGYVLERLIGAMTVQQKMDSLKVLTSPKKEEEESKEPEFSFDSIEEVGCIVSAEPQLEKEKQALQERIHTLRTNLASVERQKLELEELKEESASLRDVMNCVSAEISLQLGNHEAQCNNVSETVMDHRRQLELLMRCNALNDAISVWFDGGCVTVNGVRAGRVGTQPDWSAVNAVLGDLVLATDCMFRLYGLRYQNLYLKSRGSLSEVIDVAKKTSYRLWG